MLNAKIHVNSTIYRVHAGALYIFIDIKKFYLVAPMKYFQYTRMHKKITPQEILEG